MYTEGFESLEETEKESRRNFGNTNDVDKLLRENEKLKKSLEKEQFFNKLLDQEIQEMKTSMSNGGRPDFHSEYWQGPRGVSKGAFYLLLLITLILGGYVGYGIYYNKPMNYLNFGKSSRPETVLQSTPAETVPAAAAAQQTTTTEITPPVAKDSVPNIIGSNKASVAAKENVAAITPAATTPAATPPAAQKTNKSQKAAVKATADEEYNEEEVNSVINEKTDSAPVAAAPKPVEEAKPVIARYKVTSKANFYNNPDENSMRGTFISGSANKIVDAYDEKNGFIYVVYTNDLGFTSKGWLSKTDLTKE